MTQLRPRNGEIIDLLSVLIEGERVLLSPIGQQHCEIVFREFTSEITRYMMPKPNDNVAQASAFIDSSRHNMAQGSELVVAISRKGNDEFLGVCGLHARGRPETPELGIWLAKRAHGQKLGREAIRHLVSWARANLEFSFLTYPVDRNNIPSRKVAESLGGVVFKEERVTAMSGNILDEVVYRI